MRRRLRALFRRYADAHLSHRLPPLTVTDADGEVAGYLDEAVFEAGRLRVAGWIEAETVTLVLAGRRASAAPDLPRADVVAERGGSGAVGFDLSVPAGYMVFMGGAAAELHLTRGAGAPIPALVLPVPERDRKWVRRRLHRRFAARVIRLAPAFLGWLLSRDPRHRAAVKRGLGLDGIAHAPGRIDPRQIWSGPDVPETGSAAAPPTLPAGERLSVIVPVYNAFELLAEMLDRLDRHTDLPADLILIEDRSSDPRVRPFLEARAAAAPDRITLLENDRNLGFVGSTNRGLEIAAAGTGPVILLNSDAMVPAGWASRLVAPLRADPLVASATPMSNDAEILSVPAICQSGDLAAGQGDAIDRVARALPAVGAPVPTGVGFCMALARDWLGRVPRLDPAFGRGYGEEVDWCRRILALGGRHVAVPNLFVEHRGGSSFGSAEKRARIAENNARIARRYPEYDGEVQSFIRSDPLLTARLALGMAWADARAGIADGRVPVYLAHSLGGGAETYLQERVEADLGGPVGAAVVLRVGGAARWQVELHAPGGRTVAQCDEDGSVIAALAPLRRRHIVYSCGVGDPDPLSLPGFLAALKRGAQDRLDLLFHDYFPLSPSYTLLGADGAYRGPPGPEDRGHAFRSATGLTVALAEWQARWRDLAERANELRVFAEDSAAHVAAVWPDLTERIRVVPHDLAALSAVGALPPPPADAVPVIGVLGAINRAKGAEVLQALAARLSAPAGLVVIGMVDPATPLPDRVPVTGRYARADITRLAAAHGVTHWLIPSIWPETFSYTTHEALRTGLPVLAFDLGAQGDAVRAAPNGHVLAFDPDGDHAGAVLRFLEGPVGGGTSQG